MTEFRLLGTVEVVLDGAPLPLRGGKERGLLAVLLLNANRVVSRTALSEALWGDDPPATAAHALDVYVSEVRGALEVVDGKALLRTRPGGYLLRVDPESIDLVRFERLVEEARRELDAGAAETAEERLREALELWRGTALADIASQPFAASEALRLEELRLSATELHVDAMLALGRHAEVVPELEALVARFPVRERFRRQLMVALYRSGRQAEALESYRDARQVLVEELGIEPGRDLERTELAILRHDPSLDGSRTAAMRAPKTRYARSGEVSIAYQVTGEGPYDVVYVPPFVTNVELMWQVPSWARFMHRLASSCRLIRFDKRGTGMSDRVELGNLETRARDIGAVMDAVASPRAALIGASGGGPLAVLFAATYPERVWALVLSGAVPRVRRAPDYPIGWTDEELARDADVDVRMWTEPGTAEAVAAGLGAPEPRELAAMWRQSASPGTIRRLEEEDVDVRWALPAVAAPTLVLSREAEESDVIAGSRYLAEHIPGAEHRELPGAGHVMFSDGGDPAAEEIERFLREAWARDLNLAAAPRS